MKPLGVLMDAIEAAPDYIGPSLALPIAKLPSLVVTVSKDSPDVDVRREVTLT